MNLAKKFSMILLMKKAFVANVKNVKYTLGIQLSRKGVITLKNNITYKPIIFDNYFRKNGFLKSNDQIDFIKIASKILAFDYSPDKYQAWMKADKLHSMTQYNASFLIMTNRQFAYLIVELRKNGFFVDSINFVNSLNDESVSCTKRDLEELYDFQFDTSELHLLVKTFFEFENEIDKIEFGKKNDNKTKLKIKKNGTIIFDNILEIEIRKKIVKTIQVAYEKSQE